MSHWLRFHTAVSLKSSCSAETLESLLTRVALQASSHTHVKSAPAFKSRRVGRRPQTARRTCGVASYAVVLLMAAHATAQIGSRCKSMGVCTSWLTWTSHKSGRVNATLAAELTELARPWCDGHARASVTVKAEGTRLVTALTSYFVMAGFH